MLSLDEYRAVFDAAPDGFAVVDGEGRIRAVNPKMEQMFGWSADELEGQPVEVLLPAAVRSAHVDHREAFSRNPHDRPMGVGLDLRGRRKDGTEFPVEVSLSPWRRGPRDLRVICTIRDVSAYRRLRSFSEGALRATEDERKRIARELHDDTAQRLATLILRVGSMVRERDHQRRAAQFEDVRQELVDAAEGVKRMARGLRPPELEELGIELALRAHMRNLRESGIFRVDAQLGTVDPYLDTTRKLALYRIVQEALSNARRHSGSGSAMVRLYRSGDEIIAEVSDRGRGFALATPFDGQRGLGLIGMHERAAMIGGRISIDSEPGKGTRVRVVVPARAEIVDG